MNAQADLILHYVHMSKGTFSDVDAQLDVIRSNKKK